jgi:site-specific recombinase XerC
VTALAPVLQAFFTERLIAQRQVSGHTVAAYRDTFRLLLAFAQQRTGTAPCDLRLEDLDAALIGAFLEHLRRDRGNSARTATPGCPRSTPCSATPRCGTPSTRP